MIAHKKKIKTTRFMSQFSVWLNATAARRKEGRQDGRTAGRQDGRKGGEEVPAATFIQLSRIIQ